MAREFIDGVVAEAMRRASTMTGSPRATAGLPVVQQLAAVSVWVVLLAGDFLKEHPLPQSSDYRLKVEEEGAEAE